MTSSQAKLAMTNFNGEIFSITPTSLVTMFEIDATNQVLDKRILGQALASNENQRIFRFHNSVSLIKKNIIWSGNDGVKRTYYAAPISAEGFEMNAKGTLPTPKLSISVSDEGIPVLAILKSHLIKIGDLAGAKVTRIRTMSKFLDPENFVGNSNSNYDYNAEFSRDIFYIDRKSLENKYVIEFQLASLLDIEDVKLPARLVLSDKCTHTYRGEGCLYCPGALSDSEIHGPAGNLPLLPVPVATENDEKIIDILNGGTNAESNNWLPHFRGLWTPNAQYWRGNYVYIMRDKIPYYFVAKNFLDNGTAGPPNDLYWLEDKCSKTIRGCKFRWGAGAPVYRNPDGYTGPFCRSRLPFGGFPSVNKLPQ